MKHNSLAVSIILVLASQGASANPQGAQVVQGTATFANPSANVLNVTNSRNAIINWRQFNIGKGQTTNFIQPSSSSSVLNRVIGNDPSQLLGNLNSNGRVFLINQNGILVGEGANVNTAGFFGSTLNITDQDFLNGKLRFNGGGQGDLQNYGYIHAGEDGNVVLIAPNIENGGVIDVDNGNIILAAGESITITSLQNSSLQFEVQSPDNSVTNLGQVIARNGAAGLFAGTLKHSGSIRAGGLVRDADGTIRLVAAGSAQVSGSTKAAGGKIEILGDSVDIQQGANIDASDSAGGGEILIGGDRQGLNPDIQNATSTTIEQGAEVHADGLGNADGGKVIVFAENDVHVQGEVTARGGEQGGDGGFIETSGLQQLDITQTPDASAPNGASGEWLIDPNNITIVNGATAADTSISNDGSGGITSTDDAATLTNTTIQTALDAGTSVTISTGAGGANTEVGDINIYASISKTNGGDASLTFNAHNNINIDTQSSNAIGLTSTSGVMDITLNPDSDGDNAGAISINTGFGNSFVVTLDSNGGAFITNGNVTINGESYVDLVNSKWSIGSENNLTLNGVQGTTLQLTGSSELQLLGDMNLNNAAIIGDGASASDRFINKGEIFVGFSSIDVSTIDTTTLDYVHQGSIEVLDLVTLDMTADASIFTLDLQPNGALLGGGTLVANVTVNGGILVPGSGYSAYGLLTINGALTLNSGIFYSVVDTIEGFAASTVSADSIKLNGGELMMTWAASGSPVATVAGTSGPIMNCSGGTGCLLASPGFSSQVNPLAITQGDVDYGVTTPETVTYKFTTLDSAPIISWIGAPDVPGDWNVASNWSTGAVPTASDYVFIENGNGVSIVNVNTAASVKGLQSQGLLTVAAGGSLNLGGSAFILDASGGANLGLTITGGGIVNGPGVIYLAGPDLLLDEGILQADVESWGLTALTNAATAFQLDGNLVNNTVFLVFDGSAVNTLTGTGSITNIGIVNALADFTTNVFLDNRASGVVSVDAPGYGIVLNGDTVLDGTLSAIAGSSITLSGGSHVFANTLLQNGDLILNGGAFSGTFNQPATSLLDIKAADSDVTFNSFTLSTLGTAQFSSGGNDLLLTNNSIWNNDGVLNIFNLVGADIINDDDAVFSLVNNGPGTINITSPTSLQLYTPLENIGTVNVGSLFYTFKPVVNNGDIDIASGREYWIGNAANSSMTLANTGQLTGAGQLVVDANALFDVGANTVVMPAAMTLRMNDGGSIANIQNLTIPDTFVLLGGTISGPGTFLTPASSTTSINKVTVQNLSWISQGAVNWTPLDNAANDFTFDTATFSNEGALTLQNINVGSTLVDVGGSGINNTGVLNINPTTALQISPQLINTGTINVLTGVLNLKNTSNQSVWNMAAGTQVLLQSGDLLSLETGSDVTGSSGGLLRVDGGQLNITELTDFATGAIAVELVNGGVATFDQDVSMGSLLLDAATLTNNGFLTVTNFDWQAGTLDGSGLTEVDSVNFIAASDLSLAQDIVILTSANWSGSVGNLSLSNNAAINNNGVFTDTSTTSILGLGSVFANSGSYVLNSSGTSVISVVFDNAGSVDIQNGTLDLAADGSSNGSYAVNGVLLRSAGNHTFSDVVFSGSGQFQQTGGSSVFDSTGTAVFGLDTAISGGTVNFNHDVTLANLQLSGGVLDNSANLALSNMLWSGGTLQGAGATTVATQANLTGAAAMTLDTQSFTAQTLVNWSSTVSDLAMLGGATLNNVGVFNDSSTATISGAGVFNNSGSYNLSSAGVSTISASFINSGSITLQSGTLNLGGNTLTLGGGTLSGFGTLVGNLVADSGSVIAPGGSIGVLNIDGALDFAAGSRYDLELDVGAADRIITTGAVTIDSGAQLNLIAFNGYNGSLSDGGSVLSSSTSISGNFAPLTQLADFTVATQYVSGPPDSLDLLVVGLNNNWVGADGAWEVASNWSRNEAPSLGHDVDMTTAGVVTFATAGAVNIKSLLAGQTTVLDFSNGVDLSVDGDAAIPGALNLDASSLTVNGDLSGGAFTLINTSVLDGAGALNLSQLNLLNSRVSGWTSIDAPQLTVTGSSQLSNTNLLHNGAIEITGATDRLVLANNALITSGGSATISGSGTLDLQAASANWTVGAPMVMPVAMTLDLNGGLMTNIENLTLPGTVNVNQPNFVENASIVIPATTTFNYFANSDLQPNFDVINNGQFVLQSTAPVLNLSGANILNKTGATFSINSATNLLVQSGFVNDGSLVLAASSSIVVQTGATLTNAGSISGDGALGVNGGTLDFTAATTLADTLTLALNAGGVIENAQNLNVDGQFDWRNGTINGAAGGGFTTAGLVNLERGTLNTDWLIAPSSVVDWTGSTAGDLVINNSTITNQGEFRMSGLLTGSGSVPGLAAKNFATSSNASFINQGLLLIDAGSDTVVFDLAFNNDGGRIGILSGSFQIGAAKDDLVLDQAGEGLFGFGVFEGNVINQLGTVSPGRFITETTGAAGVLTINGDYTQGTEGTLLIKLDSTLDGLQNDVLNVVGQLTADGAIDFKLVNGVTVLQVAALIDQSFQPLKFGNFAGKFASSTIPDGLNFTLGEGGVISISSDNNLLNEVNNQLEVLFSKDDLDYSKVVRAMKFIDEKVTLLAKNDDEDEDEKKRAPRLVCK